MLKAEQRTVPLKRKYSAGICLDPAAWRAAERSRSATSWRARGSSSWLPITNLRCHRSSIRDPIIMPVTARPPLRDRPLSWRPVLHSRFDGSDEVAQRLTCFWLVRSGHGGELT